jgi:autotransporter-associated beta strand protein
MLPPHVIIQPPIEQSMKSTCFISENSLGVKMIFRHRGRFLAALLPLLLCALPLPAAILSWSGGGANAFWSNPANWGFVGTPNNGDTLIFSASQPNLLNSNNIVGLTLNQIRFVGAGGGYDIRGNAFTITNNIEATNTSGANTIENYITIATVDQVVNVTVALTLAGDVSGSVGVIKNGAGTLAYSTFDVNNYTGTTTVNGGTLQLIVFGVNDAFNGPLVINSGATVQDILDVELPVGPAITVNSGGTLDLNGLDDIIGQTLNLGGKASVVNCNPLTLSSNATITANLANFLVGNATITGALNVGPGVCTFQVNPAGGILLSGSLVIPAVVSGSATIVKSGNGFMTFSGANTFTGQVNILGGTLAVANPLALGTTAAGTTVSNTATLWLAGVSVTNEPLIIASTGTGLENASGANVWSSPGVTLAAATTFSIDGVSLDMRTSISGSGGITKTGAGTLRYSGGFNPYTGTTTVNAGILQLDCSGFNAAYGGPLIISNSTVTLDTLDQETPNNQPMTINNGGVFDLNNLDEDISGTLNMNGGTINVGTAPLTILAPSTITANGGAINGTGSVQLGAGPCVINVLSASFYVYPVVQGTAAINKMGEGWLYFFGANTYSGLTTVSAGLLWAENNLALGSTSSGTVVSNGAGVVLDAGAVIAGESLSLNGPGPGGIGGFGSLDVESGIETWAGPVVVNTYSTLDSWGGGAELHINGAISGAGSLELFNSGPGGGTLFFEGSTANTYGGLTTVDGDCTLVLNKTAIDGAIPNDLDIFGTVRNLRDYQINNSSTVTIGAAGLLDLSGITGTNTILASPVHSFSSSGNFTLGYAFTPSANLTVTAVRSYFGTKVEIWTSTGTLLASQNVASVPGTWVETPLTTPIQLTAGSHYRVAAYTAGGNYYWRTDLGGSFPNGTIDQGYEISGDAFPTSTDTTRWWFVDLRYLATLPSGGDGIGSLNGSGRVNLGANYINSFGTGTHTYDGVISGLLGIFYVDGSGLTYTLNANNTYTGATHLDDATACTVKINGSQPQSPVYVGTSDTLGGSGTVGIITAHGAIAPGNSPGVLTSSNVTFFSTGTYKVELDGPNPGTGYDQLNVNGTVALANAALNLNMAFTSPVALGQQFTIINNDAVDPISGIFAGYPNGSVISQNGFTGILTYFGGPGGNSAVLTLTAIPGTTVSSAVTAGNGNHSIDPNDCNNFSLVISNQTALAMNNVKGTLSTTTEGVVISQPYANYPNVAGHGTGTNVTPFQISTLPSFTCGTPISLQLSINSGIGSFTMNYVLQTGEALLAPSRYDLTGNVSIPDIGSTNSLNVVSGFASAPLQKVVVSLYITHQFDADLTNISLISPDSTTVLLSSANGGGGQNYGIGLTPDADRTTFDDAAGTSITSGTAPFVGTFRPQSPLSAFNGNVSVNGNWYLHIADGFGGSLGTLRGWSLFLYGTGCSTGSGACDYCMASIVGTIDNSDLTQTDRTLRSGGVASCGAPKASPGEYGDGLTRHYDIYAFTNTTAADACVSVVLTSAGDLQAVIYLNNFNPANIAANYLADSGNSTSSSLNFPQSCSATIPTGTVFFVVVDEIDPSTGGAYTLQLSGLPCPPPVLKIQKVMPDKARLYWDTSGGGYLLESTPGLTSPSWGGISNEPIVSAGNYNVTNSSVLPTNRFYRLHKP